MNLCKTCHLSKFNDVVSALTRFSFAQIRFIIDLSLFIRLKFYTPSFQSKSINFYYIRYFRILPNVHFRCNGFEHDEGLTLSISLTVVRGVP